MEGDLVAIGGDLRPETLLAAYSQGLFPMPVEGGPGAPGRLRQSELGWWSPDPRGVLPLDGLRISRSLRRSVRNFEVRIDTAFDDVIAACADPSRPHGWITAEIIDAYTALHRRGHAHSVEAWQDGRLAGGLYGVAIGGLFAGESMFHRVRDASKVALVRLVELLSADGDLDARLLDVQWRTDHLATLGVIELPRRSYLDRLGRALELPLPSAFARRQQNPP